MGAAWTCVKGSESHVCSPFFSPVQKKPVARPISFVSPPVNYLCEAYHCHLSIMNGTLRFQGEYKATQTANQENEAHTKQPKQAKQRERPHLGGSSSPCRFQITIAQQIQGLAMQQQHHQDRATARVVAAADGVNVYVKQHKTYSCC